MFGFDYMVYGYPVNLADAPLNISRTFRLNSCLRFGVYRIKLRFYTTF